MNHSITTSRLKLPSINETASIFYKRFHSKLRDNPNQLINELASHITTRILCGY